MAYITKERKILGLFLGLSVNSNIVAASTERFSKNGIVQYQDIRKIQKRMWMRCPSKSVA